MLLTKLIPYFQLTTISPRISGLPQKGDFPKQVIFGSFRFGISIISEALACGGE